MPAAAAKLKVHFIIMKGQEANEYGVCFLTTLRETLSLKFFRVGLTVLLICPREPSEVRGFSEEAFGFLIFYEGIRPRIYYRMAY